MFYIVFFIGFVLRVVSCPTTNEKLPYDLPTVSHRDSQHRWGVAKQGPGPNRGDQVIHEALSRSMDNDDT